MRRVLLAAACAAFLATAAPAAASTLVLAGGTLTFTGAGTLPNDVTLTNSGNVHLTIVAGPDNVTTTPDTPGCINITPGVDYVCSGVTSVVVDAGGGNDAVRASALTLPLTISGGTGNDTLEGGTAANTITGGDGVDAISGGDAADTLDGGVGDDEVSGGPGNDTIVGGAGDDTVNGGGGDDNVSGGDGDDSLTDGGGADLLSGGAGFDAIDFASSASMSVSLDGLANDGAPGQAANALPDIEDVYASANDNTGAVTLIGSDAANSLTVGAGKATIDGLGGADFIAGSDGDDTINARDGYPDRIRCYAGNDTVFADTLDTISPSCENVQLAAVPGPVALDDRPPVVSWSTPAAAASVRGDAATALTVGATDDRGVAKVQFYDEDRLLCEVAAAPYTCNFQARGTDVGRNTLIAVAIDTAGQASSAIRLITVQPFAPTLSLSLSPSRDKKAPYKFKASGTLTKAGECSGTVTITAKAGKKTVSSKSAKVSRTCKYTATLSFKKKPGSKLKISAKFGGNSSTATKSATSKTARLS